MTRYRLERRHSHGDLIHEHDPLPSIDCETNRRNDPVDPRFDGHQHLTRCVVKGKPSVITAPSFDPPS